MTLGGRAAGTTRQSAQATRLPELPDSAQRDLELVTLLADRIEAYLDAVRAARTTAERNGDADTVDLLTGVVEQFEKHAWFLRATSAA